MRAQFLHLRHAAIIAALTLTACGGGQPEPVAPPPQPPEAAPPPVEPAPAEATTGAEPVEPQVPEAWSDDLTLDQKRAFMKAKVLPAMVPVLAEVEALEHEHEEHEHEEHAEQEEGPTCATCHGAPFKLPTEHLPKLTMKGGTFTAQADHPKIVEIMMQKVVPTMADVLGMQPYDAKTGQGFGCAGCHTVEVVN